MKKICLRAAGVSRNKYVGAVETRGVLPFRLNVGPEETFEICRPDGSTRNAPLHHGEVISLGHSGRFLDAGGTKLSAEPSGFVVEKLGQSRGKISDGDRISLRSSQGWLTSNLQELKMKQSAEWSEAVFEIYEIPGFSRTEPLFLRHCGKEIESLRLGPHGRASDGEARVYVRLGKAAPPGGVLVSFRCDSEHGHVYIPPILLDGVTEGFSPIHFAHAEKISESGIRLGIVAEIPCTGETSLQFHGGTDGIVNPGIVSLTVYRLDRFEPVLPRQHERSGSERRIQDRRASDRRGPDRRSRHHGRNGFDNHFLERRKQAEILYS